MWQDQVLSSSDQMRAGHSFIAVSSLLLFDNLFLSYTVAFDFVNVWLSVWKLLSLLMRLWIGSSIFIPQSFTPFSMVERNVNGNMLFLGVPLPVSQQINKLEVIILLVSLAAYVCLFRYVLSYFAFEQMEHHNTLLLRHIIVSSLSHSKSSPHKLWQIILQLNLLDSPKVHFSQHLWLPQAFKEQHSVLRLNALLIEFLWYKWILSNTWL